MPEKSKALSHLSLRADGREADEVIRGACSLEAAKGECVVLRGQRKAVEDVRGELEAKVHVLESQV